MFLALLANVFVFVVTIFTPRDPAGHAPASVAWTVDEFLLGRPLIRH